MGRQLPVVTDCMCYVVLFWYREKFGFFKAALYKIVENGKVRCFNASLYDEKALQSVVCCEFQSFHSSCDGWLLAIPWKHVGICCEVGPRIYAERNVLSPNKAPYLCPKRMKQLRVVIGLYPRFGMIGYYLAPLEPILYLMFHYHFDYPVLRK